MRSRVEERAHDRSVRSRRRADADGVHRTQKIAPVRKDGNAMLYRRTAAGLGAHVSHPDKADAVHRFIFCGVMPPECPHSYDSGPYGAEALVLECLQCKSPGKWQGS